MECVKVEKREGIEVRTIHDGAGKFYRIYNSKGKVLPRIILQGFYIEQLKAFRSLDKDLRNILAWITKLRELNKEHDYRHNRNPSMDMMDAAVVKALFIAILSTYGRCFTIAKNRKFNFSQKHVPVALRDTHAQLMQLRHTFAAHKGEFEYDDCKIALVITMDKKDPRPLIFSELIQPHLYGEYFDEDSNTQLLCEALRTVVNEKYAQVTEKIFNESVRVKGRDFWIKANGKTVNIDVAPRK